MKGKKIVSLICIGLSSALLLSGCSFKQSLKQFAGMFYGHSLSGSDDDVQLSTAGTEVLPLDIDDSIEAPVFSDNAGGMASVRTNGQVTLDATATVSDGSTLTYQWYSSNVETTGGGTPIDGATQATYAPSTDTEGTVYYYAVAYHTVDGKTNLATSPVYGVTVWPEGSWQKDPDSGGYQYVVQDTGKFPTSTTMNIDGVEYTFNDEGYAVDGNGAYVDVGAQQNAGGEAAAEQAAEAQPAEGEEQAADTQPAEGETQPAAEG